MDESIPSISSGAVGSRFVSQTDIDTARARRDEQWKAAYARLGQEPPPQPAEDSFDGRSLAEKLAANRAAKQEEWEEKTKLANQFRALEEDEIMFLDSVREKQEEEERKRKEIDSEEVKSFKEAVAARTSSSRNPPPAVKTRKVPEPQAKSLAISKKDTKRPLKGVLVKKKKAPVASAPVETPSDKRKGRDEQSSTTNVDAEPDAKRQKVSS